MPRALHRSGLATLIVMLAIALTGCGPSSVATTSYGGFPPGVEGSALDIPRAFVNDSILYLTLGGSSSCPPIPTSITKVDGVLEIGIERAAAVACTADMVVTTHVLNIGPVPDELVIVDGDHRQTLTVETL